MIASQEVLDIKAANVYLNTSNYLDYYQFQIDSMKSHDLLRTNPAEEYQKTEYFYYSKSTNNLTVCSNFEYSSGPVKEYTMKVNTTSVVENYYYKSQSITSETTNRLSGVAGGSLSDTEIYSKNESTAKITKGCKISYPSLSGFEEVPTESDVK